MLLCLTSVKKFGVDLEFHFLKTSKKSLKLTAQVWTRCMKGLIHYSKSITGQKHTVVALQQYAYQHSHLFSFVVAKHSILARIESYPKIMHYLLLFINYVPPKMSYL